jgi:hypothetical protein
LEITFDAFELGDSVDSSFRSDLHDVLSKKNANPRHGSVSVKRAKNTDSCSELYRLNVSRNLLLDGCQRWCYTPALSNAWKRKYSFDLRSEKNQQYTSQCERHCWTHELHSIHEVGTCDTRIAGCHNSEDNIGHHGQYESIDLEENTPGDDQISLRSSSLLGLCELWILMANEIQQPSIDDGDNHVGKIENTRSDV